MGRYTKNIESHKSAEELKEILNEYLKNGGFTFINEGNVWRRVSFQTTSYIKIDFLKMLYILNLG